MVGSWRAFHHLSGCTLFLEWVLYFHSSARFFHLLHGNLHWTLGPGRFARLRKDFRYAPKKTQIALEKERSRSYIARTRKNFGNTVEGTATWAYFGKKVPCVA